MIRDNAVSNSSLLPNPRKFLWICVMFILVVVFIIFLLWRATNNATVPEQRSKEVTITNPEPRDTDYTAVVISFDLLDGDNTCRMDGEFLTPGGSFIDSFSFDLQQPCDDDDLSSVIENLRSIIERNPRLQWLINRLRTDTIRHLFL